MTSDRTVPTPSDLETAAVDAALEHFVARQRDRLAPLGPDLAAMVDAAADFVAGGKRLRPAFCLAGWRIASGEVGPAPSAVATAAAAWEWLQGSALVHDDLMDGSDTRRGRPSVHRDFEARHRAAGSVGDAAGFGRSTAVLLGDLMLSWCDEMLRSAAQPDTAGGTALEPDRLARAFDVLDVCKTEVVAGQFLDVVSQTRPTISAREARLVVRFKSASYTVERPLHLGAALGGGDDALAARLSAVALPLGEAFQLRDDVLGVFGDPATTGKPAGDDLREGKRTLLIAWAVERGGPAAEATVAADLGTTDGIERMRDLIVSTGALAAVEAEIERCAERAEAGFDALSPVARATLEPLLHRATRRSA